MSLSESYPFEPGSLVNMTAAEAVYDRFPAYRMGADWMLQFVAQPHRLMPRPGHVCPRLLPAIRQDVVQLVTVRTAVGDAAEAEEKVPYLGDLFVELFGDGPSFRTASLIGFFPDLDPGHAGDFIDEGHRRLRMSFVRRGLMLGEFHPLSTVASVRNPQFLVMESPVPMFAVRALSVHDRLFLDNDAIPSEDREAYLRSYLRHVGDQLPEGTRGQIEESLVATAKCADGRS